MYKRFLLALVICIQALPLFSQHKSHRKLEWQLKPSAGFNIPLTKLLKGDVTDHLIAYDDHSFYWQVIALTLFFHKHWGVEFNFQGSTSGNISKRDNRFQQSMQNEYSNGYYVTPWTNATNEEFKAIGGHIERGYLGVIYRIESKRFFVYPKLSIGVSSFYTDLATVYLKEKETNTVVEVSYLTSKRPPKDHFTIATAAAAGYKLNRWLYLNFDLLASYYKTNFEFVKTTTDLNSGQSVQEETKYKKNMFNLCLGAGVIISLK